MSEVCAYPALEIFCTRTHFLATKVIQEDFVKRRRESVGGEAMTQEDLLFRMNAARYALSCAIHRSLFADLRTFSLRSVVF